MAARRFSGRLPYSASMRSTARAAMPCAVPRQPECTAPTARATGSYSSTGVQSAAKHTSATPGSFVTSPSHTSARS